jgi:hypothetical protein
VDQVLLQFLEQVEVEEVEVQQHLEEIHHQQQ